MHTLYRYFKCLVYNTEAHTMPQRSENNYWEVEGETKYFTDELFKFQRPPNDASGLRLKPMRKYKHSHMWMRELKFKEFPLSCTKWTSYCSQFVLLQPHHFHLLFSSLACPQMVLHINFATGPFRLNQPIGNDRPDCL